MLHVLHVRLIHLIFRKDFFPGFVVKPGSGGSSSSSVVAAAAAPAAAASSPSSVLGLEQT
jgi:hypothetical protein